MADIFDTIASQQPQATATPPPPPAAPYQAAQGDIFDQFSKSAVPTTPPPQDQPASPAPVGDIFDQIAPPTPRGSTATTAPMAAPSAGKNASVPSYEERFGTGESILSRPLTTYFGIPEYREGAGGVERGVEKTLSALTSPVSLALLLATGGTSAIEEAGAAWLAEEGGEQIAKAGAKGFGDWALNWAEKNLGEGMAAKVAQTAGTVDKIASVGFAYDQIRGIANAVPQIQADIQAGDHDAALEHLTEAGIGAVFATGMVLHLKNRFGQDKYTFTPSKQAEGLLSGEREQGNNTILEVNRAAKAINLTPDENIALKVWMEAGGEKGKLVPKEVTRDLKPTNPFPDDQIKTERTVEGDLNTVTLTGPKGSHIELEIDGQTARVKGIMNAGAKGDGQRLYDNAIQWAKSSGMDRFESDKTLTDEGKDAWQRISQRHDAEFDKDGKTRFIDLAENRVPTNDYLDNQAVNVQNMDHLPPAVRKRWINVIRNAQKLRSEVKEFGSKTLTPEYADMFQTYKDVGIVHPDYKGREDYAGSVRYEPDDEGRSAYRPAESILRATKKPTHLKSKAFDNMFEAMEKGYVPKNIGAVDAFSNYVQEHRGAVGIKKAEDIYLKQTDTDGRPLAINPAAVRYLDSDTETGKTIHVPMVRIADISKLDLDTIENKVRTDEDGNHYLDVSDYTEGPKVFARNRVTEVGFKKDPETGDVMIGPNGKPVDLPVMRKTALMFHPDHIEDVRNMFDDTSWVRKTPWANSVLKTAQATKSFLLALSPFHIVTEGLRGLQIGLPMEEIMHPFNAKPIPEDHISLTEGVTHGLTLHPQTEKSLYDAGAGEGVGATGPLFQKIPVLGDIQRVAEQKLFGEYIPRLKAVGFEKIAGQLREQNHNWEDHQIYSQAARITNGIFGGLNWKQLGVSASNVDMLRMIALAPDFTGSHIDTTMSMFKPGGSVIYQSFGRMMFYNFLAAQSLNLLLHGQVHLEHPFSVADPDGKRSWSMRTLPEDTWRALTEPQSFFRNRMNPVAKTAYEALYGRDDQGKKLSDTQMVGDGIRNTIPLILQGPAGSVIHHLIPDVYSKFKTGNAEDQFYDSIMRAFGLNPAVNRTPAEKLASQRLSDRLPAGVADPSAVQRHHHLLDLEDQMRAGHTVDMHGLTPTEMRRVQTAGHEDILLSKFGRLSASDKLDVWKTATAQEKQKLLPDLLKERTKILNRLSPTERETDETYQRMRSMGLVR